jgi:VWFA-related protein
MYSLRAIIPISAACLLIFASTVRPQSQTVPPPATRSSQTQFKTENGPSSQTASDATVLRANANLVVVDVAVTDRGSAVHGLDKSRFHIFEDGREQAITSFDEHKPAAASAGIMQAALPAHTYTNVPAYPQGSAVNVLLLDGLNTPMANQVDARRAMIEYLGKIPAGTPLAIFTLSSRLRLVEGFTTDAAQLTKVLKGQSAGPQTSVMLDPASDKAVDTTVGDMATMTSGVDALTAAGVSALSSMRQFQADLTAFQTDLRVRMTLDAMQQLARYLSAIPGRKNLIWFSGSFPIALDPDDTQQDPFQAMRNYSDDIRETAELLAAARVAVYPVDARGLVTPPSLDASYTSSTNLMSATTSGNRSGSRRRVTANNPSTANDDLNATKQLMEEQASMQQIAEQTGGQEYLNSNGLKEAVANAVENGSSYYSISYVPAAKQLDGKFRKIEIRVDNGVYKLAYRHGYYADATDKASEHNPGKTSLIAAATLHGAPPSTQIQFQARVLPATDPLLEGTRLPAGPSGESTAALKGPVHKYIADVTVDPRWILFQTSPDGAHQAQVEFVVVAYDAEGKRVNYLDKGFQLNVKGEQFDQVMAKGIPVRLGLDLPEGRFSLRIAVHDLGAGRAGSMEIPVTVGSGPTRTGRSAGDASTVDCFLPAPEPQCV